MSMKLVKRVPTGEEIKELYPLSQELKDIKAKRDEEIRKIFTGEDKRFIFIIGPCSADNEDAVCDYQNRLAKVAEQVKDKILVIPRIYTNKPRTTGDGYKGMLHQPDPNKASDMLEGLYAIRKMHIRAIKETGLTAADEMLYSENWQYVDDILSYVAIGARSVEDQQHRLTASGMDIPVGMKNPTSGDLSVMMNSIEAAQNEQDFLFHGWEVHTTGNPLAHAILRGYVNHFGTSMPNYHYENLQHVMEMYNERSLENPAIVVDCNHSNSGKKYMEQIRIARDVMASRAYSPDIHHLVKGLMIESYIEDGSQKIGEGIYGKSITDPCLGWAKSYELILNLADQV